MDVATLAKHPEILMLLEESAKLLNSRGKGKAISKGS
jgi:hypothetical protein